MHKDETEQFNIIEYGKYVKMGDKKVVLSEIRTLRNNISSLRGFLQGCQHTINSETVKLEKECLAKIQSLESKRLDLERNLTLVKDERNKLVSDKSKCQETITELEKQLVESKKGESKLNLQISFLESKMKSKVEECLSVRKHLEKNKFKCLALENKLASNQAYVQEQKVVLHEVVADHKHLESSTTDLKFQVAESEAYEKALEEHVAELEAICSILREQHDEQQNYFLQKEVAYKRSAQEKLDNINKVNKKLICETQELNSRLTEESLKLNHQETICKNVERQKEEVETLLEKTRNNLMDVQDKLQVEKNTVDMLARKNDDLSHQLIQVQSEVRRLQETKCEHAHNDKESVDRKALTEIGNTVQQYFEGNLTIANKFETSLNSNNQDKITECEKQLAFERQKRLSAEIKLENLRVELEKAKVESAVCRSYNTPRRSYRSGHARTSKNENHNRSNGLEKCNEYSELLSRNVPDPLVDECNVSDIPVQDVDILSVTDRQGRSSNLSPAHEEHSVQSLNMSPPFAAERFANFNGGNSISPRATQKMEEAKRKALALLNGIK
uniref:myosin-7B-like n=1 Tax=Styela clava TaxID=7725 RepID=UPI0019393AC8|nr:myosin-7B-like [Styela clava]